MNNILNKLLLLLLIIILISPFFMIKVNAVTDEQKEELKRLLKEDGFTDLEIEALFEGMTDEEYESLIAGYKNAGTVVGDDNTEDDDDEDDPEGTGTPAISPTNTTNTGENTQSTTPTNPTPSNTTGTNPSSTTGTNTPVNNTNENNSNQKLAYTGVNNYYILLIALGVLIVCTGIKYKEYNDIK